MARCALINGTLVDNVIEADLEFANSLGYDFAIETDTAAPGWLYVDGVFSNPVIEEASNTSGLTPLAFTRLFTLSERVKMQTSDDPIIQDGMLMLQVVLEIKLDDPDTIAFVRYAAYNNYIEPHRVAEILGE